MRTAFNVNFLVTALVVILTTWCRIIPLEPLFLLYKDGQTIQQTVTPTLKKLQVDKACPASTKINAANNHSPPSELLPLKIIREATRQWHSTTNCTDMASCNFESIGQHLLRTAIKNNQTLLTVQVGAMDGKSNDPMYEMFVEKWERPTPFPDLSNWLPVLIEPVPTNYENLIETYTDVATAKGLGCAVPINAAVSYDKNKTSCPFCQTNIRHDAPQKCKEMPDWQKYQLGSLDCEYHKKYYGAERFDLCILQDPLPCTSIMTLLSDKSVPSDDIAMLQIDIEGYEYLLFEGYFGETPDHSLPPVIHFEHKVMTYQDGRFPMGNMSRFDSAVSSMRSKGYVLYDEGEDYLAIHVGSFSSGTEAMNMASS